MRTNHTRQRRVKGLESFEIYEPELSFDFLDYFHVMVENNPSLRQLNAASDRNVMHLATAPVRSLSKIGAN